MKAGTISCYCITWCLTRDTESTHPYIHGARIFECEVGEFFENILFWYCTPCTTCRALMHILLNMQAYTIKVCQLCSIVSDIGLSLSGRCGD